MKKLTDGRRGWSDRMRAWLGSRPHGGWLGGWWPELLLTSGLLALTLLRFAGWLQDSEPVGWDTPGHYAAFVKMATEYLPAGRVTGYMPEWFAGFDLFTYYAPLWFIAAAAAWWLTLGLVPLALFFRLATLATLLAVPAAMWFLADAFFGRRVARWMLALAPVWLFFPRLLASIGPGAGAALWIGLIPAAGGEALLFFGLGCLERWRQRPERYGWLLAWSLLTAALAMTHTVGFIVGSVIYAAHALGSWRHPRRLALVAAGYALAALMALWWLLPLAQGMELTSSELHAAAAPLVVFSVLFPFQFPWLPFFVALLVGLILAGVVLLARQKRWTFMATLAVPTAALAGQVLWGRLLPWLPLHYERFARYAYVLLIVAAAYGAQWLWEHWAAGVRRRQAYLALMLGSLGLAYFFVYDFRSVRDDDAAPRMVSTWTWGESNAADEAQAMLDAFAAEPDVREVAVFNSSAQSLADIGSHNYFQARLPLLQGKAVLGGLYVESSPLIPFYHPALEMLDKSLNVTHGDTRLLLVAPFRLQPTAVQLDRLRHLGATHVVANSAGSIGQLKGSALVEPVRLTSSMGLFRFREPEPPVEAAGPVACYFELAGRVPFRDLAMAAWAGERTFRLPIVDGGARWPGEAWLDEAGCGAVILDAAALSDEELAQWTGGGRPAVMLGGAGGDYDVPEFALVSSRKDQAHREWPAGWVALQEALERLADEGRIAEPAGEAEAAFSADGQTLTVRGDGPAFIRAGYSAYWRADDAAVSMVSPAFIHVTGAGERTLRHVPDAAKKWSAAVSLAAVAGWLLIAGGLMLRRAGRRS
jgi:hypothetical protein